MYYTTSYRRSRSIKCVLRHQLSTVKVNKMCSMSPVFDDKLKKMCSTSPVFDGQVKQKCVLRHQFSMKKLKKNVFYVTSFDGLLVGMNSIITLLKTCQMIKPILICNKLWCISISRHRHVSFTLKDDIFSSTFLRWFYVISASQHK